MDGSQTPFADKAAIGAPADGRSAAEIARDVLHTESAALALFADSLDAAAFQAAVDTILGVDGRIIVSGMGKSGHVGKKIAATLASTGTPAQFVHPGEASHGDLGMVTPKDAALVLSNSGETPELLSLIAHSRRFEIPLIGVASGEDSALIRASDVALLLPKAPEACSMGLAPTTSTTLTLALGDALAVAVMAHRDFSPAHFRTFHPGGKLGAKLLTARSLMHGPEAMPLVSAETPMAEAIVTMTSKAFGATGVTDAEGRLIGVVTDGDLRRNINDLMDLTAGDVATREPRVIHAGAIAEEVVARMNGDDRPITCIFVVADEAEGPQPPIGVIHIHDCLRAGLM